jgi:hypothetical protein
MNWFQPTPVHNIRPEPLTGEEPTMESYAGPLVPVPTWLKVPQLQVGVVDVAAVPMTVTDVGVEGLLLKKKNPSPGASKGSGNGLLDASTNPVVVSLETESKK